MKAIERMAASEEKLAIAIAKVEERIKREKE